MNKTLYVGNLPYNFTEDRLHEIFQEVAPVTRAQIIMDRATGQSKGFAFVEMADEEGARAAIEKLNGADADGRRIVVNEARPREERPRGGGGGGGGYGGGGGGNRW